MKSISERNTILTRLFFVLLLLVILTSGSTAQWTHNPTVNNALCTAANNQYTPAVTGDGAGGAIVTWQDFRSGTPDIYAQRINSSGAVQWTSDGVALCTAASEQSYQTITGDGAGGAI